MSANLQPVTRNNWQEMIQLTEFPLDFSSRDVPLFFQIYQLFKEEILHNHIQYNDLLPSIRGCARLLHVSKNTVEVAYQLRETFKSAVTSC